VNGAQPYGHDCWRSKTDQILMTVEQSCGITALSWLRIEARRLGVFLLVGGLARGGPLSTSEAYWALLRKILVCVVEVATLVRRGALKLSLSVSLSTKLSTVCIDMASYGLYLIE
jgi:hypothetical protein